MEQGSHLRAQRSIDQCEYFRLPRIGGGDEMRFRHSPHELLQVAFSGGAHLSSGFGLFDHIVEQTSQSQRRRLRSLLPSLLERLGSASQTELCGCVGERGWVCQARAYVAKLAEHVDAFEEPVGMEIVEMGKLQGC